MTSPHQSRANSTLAQVGEPEQLAAPKGVSSLLFTNYGRRLTTSPGFSGDRG